jgi:hypothetical protein
MRFNDLDETTAVLTGVGLITKRFVELDSSQSFEKVEQKAITITERLWPSVGDIV